VASFAAREVAPGAHGIALHAFASIGALRKPIQPVFLTWPRRRWPPRGERRSRRDRSLPAGAEAQFAVGPTDGGFWDHCNMEPAPTPRPGMRSRIISKSRPTPHRLWLCVVFANSRPASMGNRSTIFSGRWRSAQPISPATKRFFATMRRCCSPGPEGLKMPCAATRFFTHDDDSNPDFLLALGLAGLRTPLLPKELKADQQELYISAGKAAFDFMKGDKEIARVEFQRLFQRVPACPTRTIFMDTSCTPAIPMRLWLNSKNELQVAPSAVAEGYAGVDSIAAERMVRRTPLRPGRQWPKTRLSPRQLCSGPGGSPRWCIHRCIETPGEIPLQLEPNSLRSTSLWPRHILQVRTESKMPAGAYCCARNDEE